MVKKILKLYGKALITYWAFAGAGVYLKRFWDCYNTVCTSDDPRIDFIRNESVLKQGLFCVDVSKNSTFKDAVDGYHKTIIALMGKRS